jgi:hypothetical protein
MENGPASPHQPPGASRNLLEFYPQAIFTNTPIRMRKAAYLRCLAMPRTSQISRVTLVAAWIAKT